jgi:cystathionine beta-lyase/cystathionine gamma-synthase
MGFETQAVHAGHGNDPQTGAISFPIYQTSTFSQEIPGTPRLFQDRELSYGRSENPIRTALENAVAELEGADYGIAFSSGLAAINAVIQLLKAGDHVVAVRDLYGGAYRQFTHVHSKFGIEFSFVDGTNISEIEAAIRPETALVWLETP